MSHVLSFPGPRMQSASAGFHRSSTRLAPLAPKHASGRLRHALKVHAMATVGGGSTSFMGVGVRGGRSLAVAPRVGRVGRSSRLTVKSM